MRRILKVAAFIMSAAFIMLIFACPQKAEPKEPTRYTVTFNKNADDAVGTMSSQIVVQGTPTALQKKQFTRSNFEFLGWATSPNGEKVYDDEANFTATSDITLYAVWARNIFYVTFDKNAETATGEMEQQSFGAGLSQSLNSNSFENVGYHFTGWATSPSGEKVYNDGESITIESSTTLYAIWEINKYTVTFSSNGGTGTMNAQEFTHGVEQNLTKNTFTRANHTFAGWARSADGAKEYDDEASYTATINITLYAVWELNEYTVTFNSNGGFGTMASQVFTHGVPQNLSANSFSRTDYAFTGWAISPGGEKVYDNEASFTATTDTTLYAVWARNIVYVTFDKNDLKATGEMEAQSFGVGLSQSLRLNAFEKDGYHFTGWATSQTGAKVYNDGDTITIASNTTLYAVWEINKYTVTFNSNGGTGTMASQVFTHEIAQKLIKNIFTRENYSFVGWARSSNGTIEYENEANYTATSDITLYAVWELNKYTVSFDANGGSRTMQPQIFTHGIAQNLRANNFSRTGYTFSGWSTSADGSKVYGDKASFTATSDITLYAVWELNKYTVNFTSNDGYGTMAPQIFTHGVAQKLTKNNFSRTGYTFVGWSTSYSSGKKVYDDEESITITSKMYLGAVWERNKYTVNFDANGGSGTMEPQVFYHDIPQSLIKNSFTRENYKFLGWATSPDGKTSYFDESSMSVKSDITLYAVWIGPYLTFGEWPQTVLPSDSTVIVDESQSREVGMFTYYKGSDDNWYVKQAENASYKRRYSDGTLINQGGTTTRYFKVEPIKWRVLEEKDGKKFLLAENRLLALPYFDNGYDRTIGTETIYTNNYKHSKIRAWLNGYNYPKCDAYNGDTYDCADYQNKGFLQTAFTSVAQSKIVTTTVDNSAASAGYSGNPWASEDTDDKIFLLSNKELTTASYFSTDYKDFVLSIGYTDFGLATGVSNYGGAYGGVWWLRSPYYYYDYSARYIYYNGFVHYDYYVSWGGGAVVPALWLEP